MEQPKLEYHDESVRYCLGEMTPGEEETFEARMFAEPALAVDVQSLEEFRHALRDAALAQAASQPVRAAVPEPAAWVRWLQGLFRPEVMIPSAAALGLGIVLLSQNMNPNSTTPPLGEPQPTALMAYSIPSVTLTADADATRGGADIASVDAGARGYHVAMYLPDPDAYEAYDAEIRTASGEFLHRAPVELADGGKVSLFIPGDNLTPGAYEVVVEGRSASVEPHTGKTAATAHFRVE